MHYSSWLPRGQSGTLPQWCSCPQPCRDSVLPPASIPIPPSGYSDWTSQLLEWMYKVSHSPCSPETCLCVCVWCGVACAQLTHWKQEIVVLGRRGESSLLALWNKKNILLVMFVSYITCKFKMGHCLSTVCLSQGNKPFKVTAFHHTFGTPNPWPQKPRWPEIRMSQLTRTCSPWCVVSESFLHHPQRGHFCPLEFFFGKAATSSSWLWISGVSSVFLITMLLLLSWF